MQERQLTELLQEERVNTNSAKVKKQIQARRKHVAKNQERSWHFNKPSV